MKGKSSRRTTARGEEGLIGRGVLERVIEAYTHPVAIGLEGRPIDSESNLVGVGSHFVGRDSGKNAGGGGVVVFLNDGGLGEGGVVDSECKNVEVEVYIALRRQLPTEARENLETNRNGGFGDVV